MFIINIIGGLILGVILFFIIRYLLKKRKLKIKAEDKIPQEVLDDLDELERRLKESNGNKTPQEIFWNYTRERSERGTREQGRRDHPGFREPDITNDKSTEDIRRDREPERRESIQVQSNSDTTKKQRESKTDWANFS